MSKIILYTIVEGDIPSRALKDRLVRIDRIGGLTLFFTKMVHAKNYPELVFKEYTIAVRFKYGITKNYTHNSIF